MPMTFTTRVRPSGDLKTAAETVDHSDSIRLVRTVEQAGDLILDVTAEKRDAAFAELCRVLPRLQLRDLLFSSGPGFSRS